MKYFLFGQFYANAMLKMKAVDTNRLKITERENNLASLLTKTFKPKATLFTYILN